MHSLTVFDHLALHPFMADLPAGWLHRLAAVARPVRWMPGRRLFREDAPAEHFWLLGSGEVALDFYVPGRGDVAIERLGAGDVVGCSWLLKPHRRTLGAITTQECRAIEFAAGSVRDLLAEDPDLGNELTGRFFTVVAGRLQAARSRLIELTAYPVTGTASGDQ